MNENRQQKHKGVRRRRTKAVKSSALYQELSQYQRAGVELWLNGKRSGSFHIADCVCETTNYMRDYYLDCQDRVCGIAFDEIRREIQNDESLPYDKTRT